jgi:gliding motility-associated lipoprotein GldD
MHKQRYLFFLVLCVFIITSCNNDNYIPKPRAFFRIDLPQKDYLLFDTILPYSFEYPSYTKIKLAKVSSNEKYWMNIVFPDYNATLHITYKAVNNNIDSLIESSRKFVDKHISKASSIKEKSYENEERKVFGVVYQIKGNEVASPYQFYITDKQRHYIRGALYFNMEPKNDSLAPVIEFIEKDIDHLIGSLNWK